MRLNCLLVLALVVPLAGCGRTALVTTRDMRVHEGVLVDGSGDALRIDPVGAPAHDIPRADIVEIDHPGNVALTFGLGASAVGGGLMVLGAVAATSSDGLGFLGGLGGLAVGAGWLGLGLPLAIGGYERWTTSTGVVQQRARVSVELVPTGLRGRF